MLERVDNRLAYLMLVLLICLSIYADYLFLVFYNLLIKKNFKQNVCRQINQKSRLRCIILPSSITCFNFFPSADPDATSALSMSPVDKWHTQNFSFNKGA